MNLTRMLTGAAMAAVLLLGSAVAAMAYEPIGTTLTDEYAVLMVGPGVTLDFQAPDDTLFSPLDVINVGMAEPVVPCPKIEDFCLLEPDAIRSGPTLLIGPGGADASTFGVI